MKLFPIRLTALLVPLALGATLAACGGDDGDATGSSSASPAASSAPAPAASASDVNKAFVRQMVPHHEMAVEMAELAKTRAEHDEIKELSTAIIAAQTDEIAELKRIAKRLGVKPDTAAHDGAHGETMAKDAAALGLKMEEMGMSMDMDALEQAKPFDAAFIDDMTAHHAGAIAMAKAQLAAGDDPDLKKLAGAIIAAQEGEIAGMAAWKAEWYPGATPAAEDHSVHSGH